MSKSASVPDLRKVPDLKGRWVECYHEGIRMARVRGFPNPRQVSVEFQARPGRTRIGSELVRGVWWRKKVVTLAEWTAMRLKSPGGDGR